MKNFGQGVQINDWRGMVSNRGRFPGKPGEASYQLNLRIVKPGELSTRQHAEDLSTYDGVSVGGARIDGTDYVVIHDSTGIVYATTV